MHHVTSTWALSYCLADPALRADPIFTADSSSAHEAFRVLTDIAAAARAADHPLGRARRTIAAGWSADEPHAAAARLLEAHADTAHTCALIAGAARRVAEAIDAAHVSARAAYADADTAIAARDLLYYRQELGLYPGWDLPTMIITDVERQRVDGGRRDVVAALDLALDRVYRTLDSGVAAIARSLDAAPWDVLPAEARPHVSHGADERNQANLAALRADLEGPSGPARELAIAVNRALLETAAAGQTAQLLVYDPTDPPGQGSVAIAIGDVDAASSVAVVTPGIMNSPTTIGDSIPLAAQLNDAVVAEAGVAHGTTATVLWWGYDIPVSWPDDPKPRPSGFSTREKVWDTMLATGAIGADVAGARLAAFTTSLRAVMPVAARLTLVGHSWSSMVVSQAALRLGKSAQVDNIVLLGAPGAGYLIRTAQDYEAVDTDQVYVIAQPNDPVPMSITDDMVDMTIPAMQELRKRMLGADPGAFGPDPASAAFGAQVVDAVPDHPSHLPISFGAHALSTYLSGDSLAAVAAVAAGHGSEVPLRRRS